MAYGVFQARRSQLVISMLVVMFAGIISVGVSASESVNITLLHLSDYHSHAVPFFSEGEQDVAGIARAIAFLKAEKPNGNTLVFSGGDTINKGTPAWSDKYQALEWAWLNNIVDAMAYGNHDSDYGPEAFAKARKTVTYPILSANVVDETGNPMFLVGGKNYVVYEVDGVRIGVFASAGSDYEKLVNPDLRPAKGAKFLGRIEAVKEVVDALRNKENVDFVVSIGHAETEEDIQMAKLVPGIDLIFGSHSHEKRGFYKVENTNTWMLSSFQYLTYISKVQLAFKDGQLADINGELVQMSSDFPEDPFVAEQVAKLQRELETDPQYGALFERIGVAGNELGVDGLYQGETVLGNLVADIMRSAAKSHVALSTSSSFRAAISPGEVVVEGLRTAIPYKNALYTYTLNGEQLQELLNVSVGYQDSGLFSQVSGVRFAIEAGKATDVQVLKDPANPQLGYAPVEAGRSYTVATTNYQGQIAAGYKDVFAKGTYVDTGLEVQALVRDCFEKNSPVSAELDGRIAVK